jgi:hypothetical protein
MRKALRAVAILFLGCACTAVLNAFDSSESTDRSGESSAFLSAIASDTRASAEKIDYRAVHDDELVAAGESICGQLAKLDREVNGLDVERAEERIITRYDLARAVAKPGAEQDPGVPLRNPGLRLASAIGRAALQHLCPDQPFNPAS